MARMLDALRRLEATNRLVAPVAPAAIAVEQAQESVAVAVDPPIAERRATPLVAVDLDEPPFEPTFGPLVNWDQRDAGFAYASHALHDALDALDELRDAAIAIGPPARCVTTPMVATHSVTPPTEPIAAPTLDNLDSNVAEEPERTSTLDEFDPIAVLQQHELDHESTVTAVGLADAPTVAADVLSTIQFAEHWATIALEDYGVASAHEAPDDAPPGNNFAIANEDSSHGAAAVAPVARSDISTNDKPAETKAEETSPADQTPMATEATEARPAPAVNARDVPTDDANRPQPSPAELSAKLDLGKLTLLAQYDQLADRLLSDLTATTKTCAVLLSVEHQPHVTDVALRTAMVLCQRGKQVLVIDAALAEKHLTGGLGMPVEFGLSEVLKGRVPWQQAVRATATPGLCVLPAGRLAPPRLADDDRRLKEVLKDLTSQWDLVLLDGGSLVESSAQYVACAARNVYLVVRLGETNADATAQAVQSLAAADVVLRGCIVTNG